MDSAWTLLARITLAHDYFSSGRAPLRLSPSPETAQVMARLGLRLRHGPAATGGAELWYVTHGPLGQQQPAPILSARADDVLTLLVTTDDPSLWRVTALDQDGIRCFGNAAVQVGTDDNNGSDTLDFTPAQGTPHPATGPVLNLSFEQEIKADHLTLTRLATDHVALDITVPGGAATSLSAALSGVDAGLYRLGGAKGATQDIVLAPPPVPFGLIEISLTNSNVPATQRLVLDKRQVQPQTYRAAFTARKTHWRYVIVGLEDTMASVTGGPKGTSFGVGQATQVNGAAGLSFTSATALPMMQVAAGPWPARLSFTRDGQAQDIVLPLPGPDITRLDQGPTAPRWLSTMFVYV